MGKDRPRRARHRSLQSGTKAAGFLGVFAARGSDAVDPPPDRQSRQSSPDPLSRNSLWLVKSSKKKNTKKASRRAAKAAVKKRAKKKVSAKKAKKTARKPAKKAVKKTAKKTKKPQENRQEGGQEDCQAGRAGEDEKAQAGA